ncbi:sugar O-acetyltransferase [Dactylosporangium sp. CS-033363]|uniref:sugar O-acetyltransferase n=1 Tax=Dactylosporangium sp. CS-033363 TaxID=3239935 RepID=UPI003D8CB62F
MTEKSMRQRMLDGELYIADAELGRDYLRAQDLTRRINALPAGDGETKRKLLTELLGGFGDETEIRAPMQFDYGYQTRVGARSFVNFGLVCLDVARVTIGDDVQIGPNVQLLTAWHPVDPQARRDKWEAGSPIVIGDNVWLGGGVIVGPGVTIGTNTVVGAGAVVVKDLPANVVAVGNPARVVREILDGPAGG